MSRCRAASGRDLEGIHQISTDMYLLGSDCSRDVSLTTSRSPDNFLHLGKNPQMPNTSLVRTPATKSRIPQGLSRCNLLPLYRLQNMRYQLHRDYPALKFAI